MARIMFFTYRKETLKVEFVSSSTVIEGVTCEVYVHPETQKRDLGIITIEPGKRTPLQRVVRGEETIEDYVSGRGRLSITHLDGTQTTFFVDPTAEDFAKAVQIGEIMQWQASDDEQLVVFEICFPPYQDGRFESIEE